MVKGLLLSAVLVLAGCSQYSTHDLGNGLQWHGLRQTGDFASWQHTSVITKGSAVQSFATNGGKGFVDPLLGAGGAVGAGYFIGSGLKNQDGDSVYQSQGQGQGQHQYQKLNVPSVE